MSLIWATWPSIGVVAIYEEDGTSGDRESVSAPRNAPAYDPESHLDKIKFHTALDNLEVIIDEIVTISHAAGDAGSTRGGANAALSFGKNITTYSLLEHDLGYEPLVLVSWNDNTIVPGFPVQTNGSGGGRYVTPYVTSTEVRLHQWMSAGSSGLAAIDIDYRVLVIRAPRDADESKPLRHYDPVTGIFSAGFDRFSSERRYLQVVPGGSPFGVFSGRSGDLDNGAPLAALPDGTTYGPVPTALKARTTSHDSYGASMAYGGDFEGSDVFQVQAPTDGGDTGNGWRFDPVEKRLTIDYEGRRVATTAGTLVNVLTTSTDLEGETVSFPDFTKNNYIIAEYSVAGFAPPFDVTEQGRSYVTAVPQEYDQSAELMDVPAGADFFCGHIKLDRTSAPSHTWLEQTVGMILPENVSIPFLGGLSALVEADIGFARMIHLYMEDGKLKLGRQQSVCTAPGQGADWNAVTGGADGGRTSHGGTAGLPIYGIATTGTAYSSATYQGRCNRGGSNQPSLSDPTDHASTYSIDIINLRFGRRS